MDRWKWHEVACVKQTYCYSFEHLTETHLKRILNGTIFSWYRLVGSFRILLVKSRLQILWLLNHYWTRWKWMKYVSTESSENYFNKKRFKKAVLGYQNKVGPNRTEIYFFPLHWSVEHTSQTRSRLWSKSSQFRNVRPRHSRTIPLF